MLSEQADAATDGRSTRWDQHKAERREKILVSAIALIERDGEAVGVQAIATSAGVPRSVVYRIFTDRADLDEQIRVRITEHLMQELAPALEPRGTMRGGIDHAVATYVGWVRDHPRLHRFLGAGTSGPDGSSAVSSTRLVIGLTIAQLMRATTQQLEQDQRMADTVAFSVVGLVDGAVNRWTDLAEPEITSAELTAFLSDAVWDLVSKSAERLGLRLDPDAMIADLLPTPAATTDPVEDS